jgi:hypothetical protein
MFERTQIGKARESLDESVTIAGWVKRTRVLRNISFVILRDVSGEIQVTVKDDELRKAVEDLGREDVIKVTGRTVSSEVAKTGVEFIPDSIEVVNKAKQPLPFDLFGQVKAELDTRVPNGPGVSGVPAPMRHRLRLGGRRRPVHAPLLREAGLPGPEPPALQADVRHQLREGLHHHADLAG